MFALFSYSSLVLVLGTVLNVSGSTLERRSIQSSATCLSEFSWMDTKQQNLTPCVAAAQLGAICNFGNYNIPPVTGGNYDIPGAKTNSTPATFCTCSWAFYNLLSACTVCQNAEFASRVPTYSAFAVNCAGSESTTYFPSNITLPDGVAIPFYATTDPSTWPNGGKFDQTAAKQIADTNHADVTASSSAPAPHKKSSNVGAIVGGVVGGLVVIAIAAAIAFYILRRGRMPTHVAPSFTDSSMKHVRSESDLTTSARGYTTLSSTPLHYPTSPTVLTHNTSVRSLPFQSSMAASTIPYGTASPPPLPVGSPPPGMQGASPPPMPANREDRVEPFTLPPSNVPGDRKQAGPGGFPIYDPPTAPPNAVRMDITRPVTPTQRPGGRYNPPAYTESTPGASGTGSHSRHHRIKQGSTDTLHSLTSSRSHGAAARPNHSPNSSLGSARPSNITGQLTVANPSYNTNPSAATGSGHGRQISGGSSRDEKRPRAESDSFNPKDLA
ncbi:hypothetical protein CPC08DRAFT_708220 [Agrocybe pediades]|nr:hypothetical protein CPC08DRAFT_708220 [Agrocybe pediades]